MYNLFVSGNDQDWGGATFVIENKRCIHNNEYTDERIAERFGALDDVAVSELRRFPCIFAYEAGRKMPPKFGVIRGVTRHRVQGRDQVSVEYEIWGVEPFLTHEDLDLDELAHELGIITWEMDRKLDEMNRTHWAVKDVNLAEKLKARGISLPAWANV